MITRVFSLLSDEIERGGSAHFGSTFSSRATLLCRFYFVDPILEYVDDERRKGPTVLDVWLPGRR